MADQPRASDVGANPLRIVVGQEELAHRGEVQGGAAPNGSDYLHAGSFAEGAFDVDDLVALPHGQIHWLMRQAMQLPHRPERRIPDVQSCLHKVAQFEQAHSQAIVSGFGPFHQSADRQIVQDPVGRGRVQPRTLADFLQRDGVLVRGENIQQRKGTLQDLNGRGMRIRFGHGLARFEVLFCIAEPLWTNRSTAVCPDRTAPSSVAG